MEKNPTLQLALTFLDKTLHLHVWNLCTKKWWLIHNWLGQESSLLFYIKTKVASSLFFITEKKVWKWVHYCRRGDFFHHFYITALILTRFHPFLNGDLAIRCSFSPFFEKRVSLFLAEYWWETRGFIYSKGRSRDGPIKIAYLFEEGKN